MSEPPDLTEPESPDRLGLKAGLTTSSETTDGGEHLDDALQDAIGDAAGVGGDQLAVADGTGFIPRDVWCPAYLQAHAFAGQVVSLDTLKGVPDRAGALEAAGAIYDSILDTPYLHFMIRPDSLWLQRAMVIGAFYLPVAGGIRAEVRAKRAARAAAPPEATVPPAEAA